MKRQIADIVRSWSIQQAVKSQNLDFMYKELERIVPDIGDQYTGISVDRSYMRLKVRAVHAFQMQLFTEAINDYGWKSGMLGQLEPLKGVDIGDSSGNHTLYLKVLCSSVRMTSANIDRTAVEKIRSKGLTGVLLCKDFIKDMVCLCSGRQFATLFQVLEHIPNPVQYLHELSKSDLEMLILTVPYVRTSRVGMHHLRDSNYKGSGTAEDVHVFELCPGDWKLLFQYCGWKVNYDTVYYQYPSWLMPVKWFWRWHDFEGFWGVVLKKEESND